MATDGDDIVELRINQTWADYNAALAERERIGGRYRITYDRGLMEIVLTAGLLHERRKKRLATLVEAFMVERGIPFDAVGGPTCRREDIERGLEPDSSYYIQHETIMRDKSHLDLDTDPPPDLAIEIEVSRSAMNRVSIYEELGVPEIWRCSKTAFIILVRDENGNYVEATASHALPLLPFAEVRQRLERLERRDATDQGTWLREWQA